MTSLSELIAQASSLLEEISLHPDYKALVDTGYQPDLNIADASTALAYLITEIMYPSIPFPQTPESEVKG